MDCLSYRVYHNYYKFMYSGLTFFYIGEGDRVGTTTFKVRMHAEIVLSLVHNMSQRPRDAYALTLTATQPMAT